MSASLLFLRRAWLCLLAVLVVLVLNSAPAAAASDWRLLGPEGGDVRSLSYNPGNPSEVLLGTSAGQMFLSEDSGSSWMPFAHFGHGDDYVLDHILFDPSHPATVYVAAWSLYNSDEGDLFRSDDGGRNWRTLDGVHGKSIRALAMAPSDPKTLVIGALDGVFRSRDGGATWERISPDNQAEIKNIESIAIDPQNPDIIYAGTWHLPWKTDDGGLSWHSISRGIAFDSDMFSIIVDPHSPQTVYASACSGMYKSDNKAELFHRILGLPHSAMRTRVLHQDPQRPSIVYAGTTGGLWKTLDGGVKWKLVSDPEVIVNDVMIDPRDPDHVLIATDRGGVLASTDGFAHYETSNRGFAHRVVGGIMVDRKDPNRLYVGVVNDKNLGGFFISDDAGKSWRQHNDGIADRDVLSLQQADNGVIYAGTNHGIIYLATLNSDWLTAKMIRGSLPEAAPPKPAAHETRRPVRRAAHEVAKESAEVHRKLAAPPEKTIPDDQTPRVRAILMTDTAWYAATDDGLFVSNDQGAKWYGGPVQDETNFIALHDFGNGVLSLMSSKHAFLSRDDGKSWSDIAYPSYVTGLYDLTVVPDGSWWLATREGAFHSTDSGATWHHVLAGLPARNVFAITADEQGHRLLATAQHTHGVFESRDGGMSWQATPSAGVSLRAVMNYQGRLLAASAYNGLVIEQGGETASASAANPGPGSSTARQ